MTDPLFTVQTDLPGLVWNILAGVPAWESGGSLLLCTWGLLRGRKAKDCTNICFVLFESLLLCRGTPEGTLNMAPA